MSSQRKTMRGQVIDVDAIRLKNETVPAVGNKNVDAMGRPYDPLQGFTKKEKREKKTVKQQHSQKYEGQVLDAPVIAGKRVAAKAKEQLEEKRQQQLEQHKEMLMREENKIPEMTEPPVILNPVDDEPEFKEVNENILDVPTAQVSKQNVLSELKKHSVAAVKKPVEAQTEIPVEKKNGGLAGALAKAKESKQEPLKTERQQVREKSGVKKI